MALQLDQVAAALRSYEIGEEIGRGSTGVVLAAQHRQLGRDVAVKLLTPGFAEDPEVQSRFMAEARMLASFSHVHIVPVYDFVEHDGLCLLVMERLAGGTLASHAPGLDAAGACSAAMAICSGLHYAHERGVLHRDVKPGNALITAEGVLKMTDFGIAKVLGGSQTLATRTGFVLGTPAYMAPEQAEGTDPTPATDVYGAGTVLYELLSRRLPFEQDTNPLQVLYRHVHSDPKPLREHAPDVPREIEAVVMRALSRDPAERQQSAEDLGVEIARAAAGAWGPDWLSQPRFLGAPGAILSAAHGRPWAPASDPDATVEKPLPGYDLTPSQLVPVSELEGIEGQPPPPPTDPPPPAAAPAGARPDRRRLTLVVGVLALLALAAGAAAFLTGGDDPEPSGGEGAGRAAAPAAVPASDWRTLPQGLTARQQAPAAVQFGTAWVLGGLRDSPSGTVATASVEGFDTAINSWKTGPDLPVPLHHAMAATFRGELVVMGGWIPRGSDLAAISSDRVFALRGQRWKELPRMKAPRVAGAAAVVGNRLVVVGGQADGRLVPTTEVFDGKSWKVAANIPTQREHLAAASDGRYVYAVGGRVLSPDRNLAALERYDPAADRWVKLPDMPKPLGGLGAAIVGGSLLAVGGETPTAVLGTALDYDIAGRKWSEAEPMRTPRHGIAVVAVGRNVYALDGALEPGHTNSTKVAEALSFKPPGKG